MGSGKRHLFPALIGQAGGKNNIEKIPFGETF